MSNLGNIDDSQFQAFVQRIGDEVRTKHLLEKVKNRTDIVANYAFNDTVRNTPVKTGSLRRSWSRSDVTYTNHGVVVKISNNADYASFVENGHRTRNNGWVEGRFMNKQAMDKTVENQMNQDFHNDMDKSIERLFGD